MRAHELLRRRLELAPRFGLGLDAEEMEGLESYLDSLLQRIAACATEAEADCHLEELGELHFMLATATFKYRVALSRRLWALVRGFDRHDDPELRASAFAKIKAGLFPVVE